MKESGIVEHTIPNAETTRRWTNTSSKVGPNHLLNQVHAIVSKYESAQVTERGSGLTRRLWVTNPRGWADLESELKTLGFKWADSRQSWYKAMY